MRHFALLTLLAAGCSSDVPVSVPADRPILSWTGSSAKDRNKSLLPQGFTAPDVHACAADPTRAYLAELFVNGLTNAQVNWHWAPIVRGPQASTPTIDQPEFSLAGTLAGSDDSTDDVLADHPFGFDVDVDVAPDPDFGFLPFQHLSSSRLHTEVETRTFPRAALGWQPQASDRTLMRGVWVLDCGHPPYGAEMHPPTFTMFARNADARTAVAAAVVMPYRSSLLFGRDPSLSTAFGSSTRFSSGRPFPQAMVEAVEEAILLNEPRITTHALMTANRFDSLDFLVCAPLPRPAGAKLQASWRFTTRTGVKVEPQTLEGPGCVRFVATMDSSYVPKELALKSTDWTWQQISDSASSQLGSSIDVRQALITAISQQTGRDVSNAAALQPGASPQVDAYDALSMRPGADQDAPSQLVTNADDQPFPFYGRVRVSWAP